MRLNATYLPNGESSRQFHKEFDVMGFLVSSVGIPAAFLISFSTAVWAGGVRPEAATIVLAADVSRFPRLKPVRSLPPLPIRAVPYSLIEPRRDVPAHLWSSPYCTQWDDAVERCERINGRADANAICRSLKKDAGSENITSRKTIVCTKSNPSILSDICAKTGSISILSNGMMYSVSGPIVFDYDKKQKYWKIANGAGSNDPGRSPEVRSLAESVRDMTKSFGVSEFSYSELRGDRFFICLEPFSAESAVHYINPLTVRGIK